LAVALSRLPRPDRIAQDEAGKTVIRFKNRDRFFPVGKCSEIYFAAPQSGGKRVC
jgi:hypothetical protein